MSEMAKFIRSVNSEVWVKKELDDCKDLLMKLGNHASLDYEQPIKLYLSLTKRLEQKGIVTKNTKLYQKVLELNRLLNRDQKTLQSIVKETKVWEKTLDQQSLEKLPYIEKLYKNAVVQHKIYSFIENIREIRQNFDKIE